MTRRNVTATRDSVGGYSLSGIDGKFVVYLTCDQYRRLGMRALAKGQTCLVDMRTSGIPKKKRIKP